MKPVRTKKDFVRRYQQGEFGNRTPTWDRLVNIDPSYPLYHLRNQVAGGSTYYNLQLGRLGLLWVQQNQPSDWYCAAMAPTEHTLIQGEVQRTAKGLYLRYTRVRKPMREALASSQEHVWGLEAREILRHFMCGRSYEWLGYLLDTYIDHVVEFSTYGIDFGTVPGVNTVWWECRLY